MNATQMKEKRKKKKGTSILDLIEKMRCHWLSHFMINNRDVNVFFFTNGIHHRLNNSFGDNVFSNIFKMKVRERKTWCCKREDKSNIFKMKVRERKTWCCKREDKTETSPTNKRSMNKDWQRVELSATFVSRTQVMVMGQRDTYNDRMDGTFFSGSSNDIFES
jgi:hypothetical protein